MRLKVLWLALLLFVTVPARADGPDDLYIQIYGTLQKADSLNEAGQFREAAEKYSEVELALKKFRATYPAWNETVVSYRLTYASERYAALIKFLTPPETKQAAEFQISTKKQGVADDSKAQIKSLSDEIRRLEGERTSLQEKLREALSVQPDTASNPQMVEAEKKVADLEKERDLLKVALEQAKAAQQNQPPVAESRADSLRIKELEKEKDQLQAKVELLTKEQALSRSRYQSDLKEAQAKLQQLEGFERERSELEKKLREAQEEANSSGKLSKSDLKKLKKLEQEKASIEKKFSDASDKLASLQNQREQEIRAYQSALDRIQELEKERDTLQKRLRTAELISPQEKEDIERRNLQLRTRLEAYEARPSPFTPEELALFKKPQEPSTPKSFVVSTAMTKELSPKVKNLVAEADRAFADAKFDEAEKKYEQVLNQNSKNVYTLANLASTKIELNRIGDAEETVNKALAVDPNDAFSLLLLGKIKMSQEKYDEALDALAHSTQVNPQSAESQNYLGIVLSEKGQRVAAEAALRKAIQIQPDYASAHHNLAIIYATQKPPFIELAKWHYDKAIALGHSKNPELEKMMAAK